MLGLHVVPIPEQPDRRQVKRALQKRAVVLTAPGADAPVWAREKPVFVTVPGQGEFAVILVYRQYHHVARVATLADGHTYDHGDADNVHVHVNPVWVPLSGNKHKFLLWVGDAHQAEMQELFEVLVPGAGRPVGAVTFDFAAVRSAYPNVWLDERGPKGRRVLSFEPARGKSADPDARQEGVIVEGSHVRLMANGTVQILGIPARDFLLGKKDLPDVIGKCFGIVEKLFGAGTRPNARPKAA